MGNVVECCASRDREEYLPKGTPSRFKASNSVLGSTILARIGGLKLLPNNEGKVPEEKYVLGKELGSGSFGQVRSVKRIGGSRELALKAIQKQRIPNVATFVNEVEIQASTDHPNISRLYETFEDTHCVYLALELSRGGELFDQILEQSKFTEHDAAAVIMQATRAVAYLHTQAIAHRDLKPENFLLAERDVRLTANTLKVIDFGIARRFKRNAEGVTIPMVTKAGSSYYVSPQVINGSYTEKCDIWAIGVILHILLTGAPPFNGNSDMEILNMVASAKKIDLSGYKDVPDAAKGLILRLCTRHEKERPSAQNVMTDEWLLTKSSTSHEDVASPSHQNLLQRLRKFGRQSRFKQAALHVIAYRLEDTKIKALRQKFTKIDTNGDGALSADELVLCCKEVGMEEESARSIFAQIDTDNSGSIGYSEFLTAMVGAEHFKDAEVCEAAFRIFDRDGDGQISLDELKVMLSSSDAGASATMHSSIPESEVEAIFREADSSGDGHISFEEFMAVLHKDEA
eukprot:TRINITY_DN15556_c0_g2_i1.p1 TRINITY_DN15556_c0_g2~~TRINITY_DN15556_c0_g2_i1.p1  ORF type:complete len:515 (-),score=118.51 TRINITY_DN15556_c0_g2_i1:350-1894(-)